VILENIHFQYKEGLLEIPRGWGLSKAKMFKGKCEPKLES